MGGRWGLTQKSNMESDFLSLAEVNYIFTRKARRCTCLLLDWNPAGILIYLIILQLPAGKQCANIFLNAFKTKGILFPFFFKWQSKSQCLKSGFRQLPLLGFLNHIL